ncbi:MAG: hypothetical protein ACLFVB_09750 [Thermoplasmata archaeon]
MIWDLAIWLGGFLLTVIVIFLLLKIISIFEEWKKREKTADAKSNILQVMKYVPTFIIIVPIINLFYTIFSDFNDISNLEISSEAFHNLVVVQAPLMAAFILVWMILYIFMMIVLEKYGGA